MTRQDQIKYIVGKLRPILKNDELVNKVEKYLTSTDEEFWDTFWINFVMIEGSPAPEELLFYLCLGILIGSEAATN